MRYAERARDLAQAPSCGIHLEGVTLVLAPERAPLGFVQELFQPTDLLLGGASRRVETKELRGTRAPVVVRTHVAGVAESDQVIERVISGKSEGIDVMHVELSPVLF